MISKEIKTKNEKICIQDELYCFYVWVKKITQLKEVSAQSRSVTVEDSKCVLRLRYTPNSLLPLVLRGGFRPTSLYSARAPYYFSSSIAYHTPIFIPFLLHISPVLCVQLPKAASSISIT